MLQQLVDILVVEDDRKLAEALRKSLETEPYSVRVSHTGEEAFYLVQAYPFDLMILDIMLPGHDGFEILQTLREQGNAIPVLIVTAKDTVEDRVCGLDLGADDYMLKPFALAELLARIRALLRRGKEDLGRHFELADLVMDTARRSVTRGGQPIDLTVREFDVLEYLFANAGRVLSRGMLARNVWKETNRHTPLDNVIDVQIARLRRKVDGQFEPKLLYTVRGVGFVLREPAK